LQDAVACAIKPYQQLESNMTTTTQEAKTLFAERDQLTRRIAEIDRELVNLRLVYMQEERMCGLRPESFRAEINRKYS
jgi:hypothetical protein